MEDIPKTVKWLLAFANLGCTPGEPNPQRYKSYYTYTFQEYITNKHIPKLKRPPIDLLPPSSWKKGDDFYKLSPQEQFKRLEEETKNLKPGEEISHSLPLHEIISRFKSFKSSNHILHDGYIISISKTGEPVFHGKDIELFPLIVGFCFEKGILLKKNCRHIFFHKKCNYSMAMTCWYIAQSVLYRVIQENDNEVLHPFVKMAFDYAKHNKPGHELSRWVSKCAWDFWDNQRSLHSRLRQCPSCGVFWIAKEKRDRGKPQTYCHEECENAFNQASRRKNSEASRICKKQKRKKSRRDKETELINHFKSRGQTLEDAECLAKDAVRNGQTIEDFRCE